MLCPYLGKWILFDSIKISYRAVTIGSGSGVGGSGVGGSPESSGSGGGPGLMGTSGFDCPLRRFCVDSRGG